MEADGRGRHAICHPKWVFFEVLKVFAVLLAARQHRRLLAIVGDLASSQ